MVACKGQWKNLHRTEYELTIYQKPIELTNDIQMVEYKIYTHYKLRNLTLVIHMYFKNVLLCMNTNLKQMPQ